MKSLMTVLGLAIISLSLLACGATGEKKVDFTYVISASDNINPDINGTPSSVVVRIYQLGNRINFDNASYEQLFANTGNNLGTEFIAVNEYLVDPGKRIELDLEISENTSYIGVVVGYRSVDMVTWRTVEAVPETSFFRSAGFEVLIDKLSVRVAPI
jgi:type VI secretion system protein VasD